MKLLPLLFVMLLAACGPKSLTEKQREEAFAATAVSSFAEGADFLATGSGPSWALKIEEGEAITFKSTLIDDEIIMPAPRQKKLVGGQGFEYHASSDNGSLEVHILPENCQSGVTGEDFPYTVAVTMAKGPADEKINLNGCGRFMGNERLNGKWLLWQLDSEELQATDFARGLPWMELQLPGAKFSGYAGCNRMRGNVQLQGSQLGFSKIITTKMACPDLDIEQKFTSALSAGELQYALAGDNLKLWSNEHSLVFRKEM